MRMIISVEESLPKDKSEKDTADLGTITSQLESDIQNKTKHI